MNPTLCPKCQTPRAWVGWRLCRCGYDFGPGMEMPVRQIESKPIPPKQEQTWGELFELLLFSSAFAIILASSATMVSVHWILFIRIVALVIALEARSYFKATFAPKMRVLLWGALALLGLLLNLLFTSKR